MSSVYQELVDAIHADLEANAGLPDHGDAVLYRRPRSIRPQDCPLLCVYVAAIVPKLQGGTTVTFDSEVTVGVSWHQGAVDEAQTMVLNDQTSIDCLAALEKIQDRIRALSTDGIDVLACHEVLPGISTPNDVALATGLVVGYSTSVLCEIVEE